MADPARDPDDAMRCTVCGHDLPDFIWPAPEVARPGGHYVLVETPITLRRVQDRPGDFESNVWRIVAEARVRFELCRDLHPELAALRDAQRGDPMRDVLDVPDVIRKAARWVDQGGVLDAFPPRGLPTTEDLDRAHAAVMADADIIMGGEGAGDPGDEGRDRVGAGDARAGDEGAGTPGA